MWHDISSQITGGEIRKIVFRSRWKKNEAAGGVLGGLKVNGQLLVDEDQISLTFASDKDLAKLQPGDEIEQENASGMPIYSSNVTNAVTPTPGREIKYAFDGIADTTYWQQTKDTTATWNTAGQGLPALTELKIVRHPNVKRAYLIKINNVNVPASSTGDIDTYTVSSTTNPIIQIVADQDNSAGNTYGAYIAQIYWNGSLLIDGTGVEPSGTVGSVNVAGNSLTLADSVGNWGPANDGHYAIGPNFICPGIRLEAEYPADVETFNSVKNALDGYEESRRKARFEVLRKLNKAGLSESEIVVAQCTPIETIRVADEIQERVEKRKRRRSNKAK